MRDGPAKNADLLLAGGGHSHVEVLRRLASGLPPDTRVTVVSREILTPYSGMLPGVVAGHYAAGEAHIDLAPLCARVGAQLIEADIVGLDPEAGHVRLDDGRQLSYGLLSLNTGSTPSLGNIVGASQVGVPVKPISRFLPRWQALERRLHEATGGGVRLLIVGGGPAGVELALAVHHALVTTAGLDHLHIIIAEAGGRLLDGSNDAARRHIARIVAERGIEVRTHFRVAAAEPGAVVAHNGITLAADEILWVTPGAAPAWPAASGLDCDARGFVRVNAHLQSTSHPQIFAAGDVAAVVGHQLPRAGVFAVRQGPILAVNLMRALSQRRLERYRPQTRYLSLISTGDRHAVAARGRWAAAGRWVWRWKDRIDRRFMLRYQ